MFLNDIDIVEIFGALLLPLSSLLLAGYIFGMVSVTMVSHDLREKDQDKDAKNAQKP